LKKNTPNDLGWRRKWWEDPQASQARSSGFIKGLGNELLKTPQGNEGFIVQSDNDEKWARGGIGKKRTGEYAEREVLKTADGGGRKLRH